MKLGWNFKIPYMRWWLRWALASSSWSAVWNHFWTDRNPCPHFQKGPLNCALSRDHCGDVRGWRTATTNLNFLPDPVPIGDKYKQFSEVYGHDTEDAPPSKSKTNTVASEIDKKRSGMLIQGKVRDYVCCCECEKRRVVYSMKKLSAREQLALARLKEETLYSCGCALFPEGSQYGNVMVVREGITCLSNMETTYYAGKTAVFEDVCFFCGKVESVNDEKIRKLKEDYGIVRPICQKCLDHGKTPVVRNAKKLKKWTVQRSVEYSHDARSPHTKCVLCACVLAVSVVTKSSVRVRRWNSKMLICSQ